MSGPMPIKESAFQRLVTVALLAFVIALGFGLTEAHCETSVVKPAAIYFSLSAADLGSTYYARCNPNVTEGNDWMQEHAVAKQLAMAGAFTAADVYLQSKGKPKHARALRITYGAFRVVAVVINLRNARGKR